MGRVLAAVFVLLAVGCTGSSVTATVTPRPAPVVTPTAPVYGSPARTIEVDAGERFVIALPSNPSTPYKWRLARPLDPARLVLAGTEYSAPRPGEKIAGSGGTEYWTFHAVSAGSAEIQLEYAEARSASPGQSLTFRVRVR